MTTGSYPHLASAAGAVSVALLLLIFLQCLAGTSQRRAHSAVKGIVTAPLLPRVIKEWREPTFDDFRDRTYWSLFNAFTAVLGDRAKTNPHQFAVTTMRLSAHLDPTAREALHVLPM